MNNDTDLRRLSDRPEDLADFMTIRLAALRTDPDAFGETLAAVNGLGEMAWGERLRSFLVRPGNAVFVAKRGSLVLGMARFGLKADDSTCGGMWAVYVTETVRGTGLAERLVAAGLRWLHEHGVQRIEATVAAPNGRAISFYRRLGFAIGPVCGTLRPGSTIPVYPISRMLSSP
jgi:ribosomal protein S18 acetylase RimI-like enzyme